MNQKESKPMGVSGILKWVVLAVFLLVAGCLFSCGASEVSMEIELSSTDADASDNVSDDKEAEDGQNVGEKALTEAPKKAGSEALTESERKAGSEAFTKAGKENPTGNATATVTG